MDNRNYITIQGWMVNELKLKQNKILLFAMIYGFCQDGEGEFKGSLSYICKSMSCSRTTAMNLLKELCQDQYLLRIDNYMGKINFPRYKIHPFTNSIIYQCTGGTISVPHVQFGGTKTCIGGTEIVPAGGTETAPNNTILDNTNDNTIKNKETWKTSFEIYKKELKEAYIKYTSNVEFIKQQERFNPRVDIKLTLEKAIANYWITEKAWLVEKHKKTDYKNWKSTFANALSSKLNRVYIPYDQPSQTRINLAASNYESLDNE